MPNKYHILIVFNKPIRMGSSSAPGRNISAKGSDLIQSDIVGNGTRYIKLAPHSVDLVSLPNMNATALVDKHNRNSIINENDVDIIKEIETNKIIWTSPKSSEIVIELDPASRPKPQIVPIPNSSSFLVVFDKNNTIPRFWTTGLDLKNFPLLIKLHAGIAFCARDAKWLEFEFLGDVAPFETFYVRRVYKKNGGTVLWQKP